MVQWQRSYSDLASTCFITSVTATSLAGDLATHCALARTGIQKYLTLPWPCQALCMYAVKMAFAHFLLS